MTEPAELFARLTMLLEDLHGITIEGQRADQPPEYCRCLSRQVRQGLKRGQRLCAEIEAMCGGHDA